MRKCLAIILSLLVCLGLYSLHLVNGHGSREHSPANTPYIRRYNQMFDMVHNELLPMLKVTECPSLMRRNISAIEEHRLNGNWFLIGLTPPFGDRRRSEKNKCVEDDLPRIVARTPKEQHVLSTDNISYLIIYRCDQSDDAFIMVFRVWTRSKSPSPTIYKNALEVLRINNISENVVVRVQPDRATCTNFVA
ncbi:uncharacterized protein LOC108164180 [Drosophila miranda]|uniref:uncharacterized protein LOC108164180 n=1 Tax=Drosophila miranda TaxID=7229 RepID=UPI0007E84396|nr:uncharacterized protein LOC108164180 [Drosophila miranda]